MSGSPVVAAGVDEGRRLLETGRTVVVVDGADALAALLDERRDEQPGRVAVLVGDPADRRALEAAQQLADQLFLPEP